MVLHEIVLKNLREAIQYVSQHEAEFMQEAADISMRDRDAEFARKRDTPAKADKRIAELDRIISRLYEDNVMGKLSDDRFIKMSHDYELEQSNLKSMAEVLRKELKQQEQQKTNAKAFVAAVKKYTDMQELDAQFSGNLLTASKCPTQTKNPRRGKLLLSITSSVYLTLHGLLKKPIQLKNSKRRRSCQAKPSFASMFS